MDLLDRLRAHEAALKATFPKRLIGELSLTEGKFREIIEDLRQLPTLTTPPKLFPRVVCAAMVFTARFDYKGAFWKPFKDNIQEDELNQAAWGEFFRRSLAQLELFRPPEHWMVNVFPVLFHAIIPEASKHDFGVMVRSLAESVNVEDLDDETLLAAVKTYDLPSSLRAFVSGNESASVACDLIRQVYNDYVLATNTPLEHVDDGTIRGALLQSALSASAHEVRQYRLQALQLTWRWNLASGELGVILSGRSAFDDIPLCLALTRGSYPLDARLGRDGRWTLAGDTINVPASEAGSSGVLEFGSGASEAVRVSSLGDSPLLFKSNSIYGTYRNSVDLESGLNAIASTNEVTVERNTLVTAPLEFISPPALQGYGYGYLYELNEGDIIKSGPVTLRVRGRTRPNVAILKRSLWQVDESPEILSYDESPSIRFESPMEGSSAVITDQDGRVILSKSFSGTTVVKPDISPGQTFTATVLIDGKPGGSNSAAFVVFPFIVYSDPATSRLNVFGSGTLRLFDRDIHLTQTPQVLDLSTIADDGINYAWGPLQFRLHYLGARPLMWRFSGAKEWTSIPLQCDTGRLTDDVDLEFFGTPGSRVDVTGADSIVKELTLSPSGRGEIHTAALIPDPAAIEQLTIGVRILGQELPVLYVTGSPVVKFDSVRGRTWHDQELQLMGELILDRPADEVSLHAQPYRQPWKSPIRIALARPEYTWLLDASLPLGSYELSLTASSENSQTQVLGELGVWKKLVGQSADRRSQFDANLFQALTAAHEQLPLRFLTDPEARRLTATRCIELSTLPHGSTYASATRSICAELAATMTVTDLVWLNDLVVGNLDPAFQDLPLAATCAIVPEDCAEPIRTMSDLISGQFLEFVLGVTLPGRDNGAAIAALDGFDDDPRPLFRAYYKLARLTSATEHTRAFDRLAALVENPHVSLAVRAARDIIIDAELKADEVLGIVARASLFASITSSIWTLALASRLLARTRNIESPMAPASIISRWSYDRQLGDLCKQSLSRSEKYLRFLEESTHA